MTNFDYEKWRNIKMLAARLQAIQAILELFYADSYYEDLNRLKEQLEEEFDLALNELLMLIDEDL